MESQCIKIMCRSYELKNNSLATARLAPRPGALFVHGSISHQGCKLECATGVQLEMQIPAPTVQRFLVRSQEPAFLPDAPLILKGRCLHSEDLASKPGSPGTEPQEAPSAPIGLCPFPQHQSPKGHLGPGAQQQLCLNPENQELQ